MNYTPKTVSKVIETSSYKQAYKSLKKKHRNDVLEDLEKTIKKLINFEISTQSHNHPLKGIPDAKDIHIRGDVLLIYRYTNDSLIIDLELLDLVNHKKLKNKKKQKQLKKRVKEELNSYKQHFDIPEQEDIDKCKSFIKQELHDSEYYEYGQGIGAVWAKWLLLESDCPVSDDDQGLLTLLIASLQLAKKSSDIFIFDSNNGYLGDKDFFILKTSLNREDAINKIRETYKSNYNEDISLDIRLLDPNKYIED